MPSIAEQYGREIHGDLKYWPAWLPGTLVKLGDCGTIDAFQFNRRTSLKSLGVDFEPEDRGTAGDLVHQSARGVTITFQAVGESRAIAGLAEGEAGVGIEFSRENTIVFATKGARTTAIADVDKLAADLKAKGKLFPPRYVVVTEVLAASSATVLVARTSSAGVTLRAGAAVPIAGIADLANADANFAITRNQNLATQIVTEESLTPLFRLYGFGRNWFSGYPTDVFEAQGPEDEEDIADEAFGEADMGAYAEARAQS
jgi:hypothetical protein